MAAKTPDEIRQALEKLATHMAEESKRTDVSWGKIADHIEKSSKNMQTGWHGAVNKLTGAAPVIQRIAQTLSGGFRGSKEVLDDMMKSYEKLFAARQKLYDPTATRQSKAYNDLTKQLRAGTTEIETHRKLWQVVGETMTSKTGGATLALISSLKIARDYSQQINDALKQGNASVAARSKLIQDISNVQAETGNEMQDMVKAASALTNYGFDLRSNFKDTLTTVVKMEEGLGVSYESSAQMAVATQRIGGNLKNMADMVARVKSDTALAADEAVRYATQISKAIMMLRPGSGSLSDKTAEFISRMAGAMKELTGSGDDFVKMMTDFTKESGMMGAATLGATPDFLASPEQAKKVTERFVKYVNQQLAGTSGFQRMATIQLLAEQFNTSAEVIANADKMLEKYNETQRSATSLQEQWRLQTSELSKTFSKIVESGKSIIQQVLLPVLQKLRPALSFLADTMGAIAKNAWAVRAAGVVLIGAAITAAVSFTRLAIAIGQAAMASSIYQKTLGGGPGGIADIFTKKGAGNFAKWLRTDIMTGKAVPLSRASTITRGASNLITTWLPRIGGWLSRIAGLVAGPIAAVAAAGLAGAAVGLAVDEYILKGTLGLDIGKIVGDMMSRKDTFRAQQMAYGSGGMSRQDILQNVSAMAASGKSAEEIQKFILKNASSVKGLHGETLTKERREKVLRGILEDAGQEITRQRVRMGYARQLTESTAEDRAKDAEMIELYKSIAMNTALQNELLKRAESKHELIEERKRMDREEDQSERRLMRQSIDSQSRVNGIPSGVTFTLPGK